MNRAFAEGGAGAVELAEAVVAACERPSSFDFLTPDGTPLKEQIEAIATRIYGADGVDYQPQAEKDIARMEQLGFGECRSAWPRPTSRSATTRRC